MNFPRLFAYTTGVLLIALAIILFTHKLIVYGGSEGLMGILALFGFGFLYFNLVFATCRRYIRKVMRDTVIQYHFAIVAIIPPIFWINFNETYIQDPTPLQIAIIIGSFFGAWLGHRSGLKQRVKYLQKLKEDIENHPDLPEELQRPHDSLNKN